MHVRHPHRPSLGPVHGLRQKGPCRARRDKPVCPHGRPLWCNTRHRDKDERLGTPLCADCYDYGLFGDDLDAVADRLDAAAAAARADSLRTEPPKPDVLPLDYGGQHAP